MLCFIIIFFIIGLDQGSKYLINRKVNIGVSNPILNKFFYITHLENYGVALNILEYKGYIFIPITIIAHIALVYLLFMSNNMLIKLSVSLVLGGGIGNLIDRLWKGSVTDFFEFHIGHFILPIFNFADTFIFIGAILIVLYF
jgi:signal peptidase II